MLKIECETLIVSSYDGGVGWSIAIDGEIYSRYSTEKMDDNNPIKMLFRAYYGRPYNYNVEDILNKHFEYKTLIECIDGDIEILHKEKVDDTN